MRIAQDIRQSIQPSILPQRHDLSLYTSLVPGQLTGNDLCETIIRDDRLFFCIGNTLGEGVQAAVTMAMVGAQFRSLTAFESAPDRIVSAINETQAESQRKMTLFVGVLDLTTGRLAYCNAAHHVPLVMDTEVSLLPGDPDRPVGAQPGLVFTPQEMTLASGSMLFLYTDGQKVLGEKAVRGAALQALKLNPSPKAFFDQMLAGVDAFTGGTKQRDDITMMVVCRPQ